MSSSRLCFLLPFDQTDTSLPQSRIQKASRLEGETAMSRLIKVGSEMFREEGAKAFYKGITPRIMRVAPGASSSARALSPWQA